MRRFDFVYNEPRFGSIDIEGPEMIEEDAIREIEQKYPLAIDIEITGMEDID